MNIEDKIEEKFLINLIKNLVNKKLICRTIKFVNSSIFHKYEILFQTNIYYKKIFYDIEIYRYINNICNGIETEISWTESLGHYLIYRFFYNSNSYALIIVYSPYFKNNHKTTVNNFRIEKIIVKESIND